MTPTIGHIGLLIPDGCKFAGYARSSRCRPTRPAYRKAIATLRKRTSLTSPLSIEPSYKLPLRCRSDVSADIPTFGLRPTLSPHYCSSSFNRWAIRFRYPKSPFFALSYHSFGKSPAQPFNRTIFAA